jgi:hypothetical protein
MTYFDRQRRTFYSEDYSGRHETSSFRARSSADSTAGAAVSGVTRDIDADFAATHLVRQAIRIGARRFHRRVHIDIIGTAVHVPSQVLPVSQRCEESDALAQATAAKMNETQTIA